VAKHYINGVNFTEPIFVVVIMAIASSRPVLYFAEGALQRVANLGKGTPAAWWLAILTAGPLLGSFITEPAAMTICALLLVNKFFKLQPSMSLRYATIGLLFVHISIGGTLTHFAAPPVVMVASRWEWDTLFMLKNFGWKSVISILIANTAVFLYFRKELLALRPNAADQARPQVAVPTSLVLIHLLFIAFVVYAAHYAAIVVLAFMFFLAFVAATERNQDVLSLRSPVLVGFFLAGLVIHGGCQQWWIEPVLTSLNPVQLLLGATVLTAFNDNAAITYLASLVPGFSDQAKLAVVAGAVAGGGLTVIANAPNPAGQSILQSHFGPNGVDALKLFFGAAMPTAVCVLIFLLLP
jgi:Na+/H+ antiporter NhaD/arsenite permease-like protein